MGVYNRQGCAIGVFYAVRGPSGRLPVLAIRVISAGPNTPIRGAGVAAPCRPEQKHNPLRIVRNYEEGNTRPCVLPKR